METFLELLVICGIIICMTYRYLRINGQAAPVKEVLTPKVRKLTPAELEALRQLHKVAIRPIPA